MTVNCMDSFEVKTTHYDVDGLIVEVDGSIVRITQCDDMIEISIEMLQSLSKDASKLFNSQ